MLLNLSKSTLSRISGVLETVENLFIQKKSLNQACPPRTLYALYTRELSAFLLLLYLHSSSVQVALPLIAISQSFESIWKRI